MKNLGSLTQKRRPKLCDHIPEVLAWLGSNSRERRRQEFPTVEAQKDGLLCEVISPLSSLVNKQGAGPVVGRVSAFRLWTVEASSVCSMQMKWKHEGMDGPGSALQAASLGQSLLSYSLRETCHCSARSQR